MVFFVISGYLVGGLAIVRLRKRGFSAVDFGIHRTSRIYTVLIPALCVGWLLDSAGLQFFNHSQLYTAAAQYKTASLNVVVAHGLNIQTWIGNLLMVENMLTPVLGSNGPLWSLAYEWWYYCMFACAMVAAVGIGAPKKILAAVALLAMCVLLPHRVVFWSLMWLLGVGVALYGETKFWKPPAWLGVLAFVATVAISRLSHSSKTAPQRRTCLSFVRDLFVALGFSALLLGFHDDGKPLPFANLHEGLAEFSYTTYLTHFPMLLFLVAMLHDRLGLPFLRQPNLAGLAYYGSLLVVVSAYCWIVSRLTEVHTPHVRAFLTGLIRRKQLVAE